MASIQKVVQDAPLITRALYTKIILFVPERLRWGEIENNMKAVDLILQKIVKDPQSSSCPNISYADYTGPIASAYPTGAPLANIPYQLRTTETMNNTAAAYPTPGFGFNGKKSYNGMRHAGLNVAIGSVASTNPTGSPFANTPYMSRTTEMMNNTAAAYPTQGFNFGSNDDGLGDMKTLRATAMGLHGPMAAQALENLKMTLRSSGYTESATGIVGVNQMGPNMTASSLASMQEIKNASTLGAAANTSFGAATSQASCVFGPVGSTTMGQQQSTSLFDSFSPNRYGFSPMLNTYAPTPGYTASANTVVHLAQDRSSGTVTVNVNKGSFGLGTVTVNVNKGSFGLGSTSGDKSSTKQEMEVPENIVGTVYGLGGRGVVEIEKCTDTKIKISRKGVYAPGTCNRIVCIHGTVENITRAQYMIQQRIQQEEYKRARQGTA